MKNKKIIKIINEVITEFDFLGNDEHLKGQEDITLLKNEDMQKQFIKICAKQNYTVSAMAGDVKKIK